MAILKRSGGERVETEERFDQVGQAIFVRIPFRHIVIGVNGVGAGKVFLKIRVAVVVEVAIGGLTTTERGHPVGEPVGVRIPPLVAADVNACAGWTGQAVEVGGGRAGGRSGVHAGRGRQEPSGGGEPGVAGDVAGSRGGPRGGDEAVVDDGSFMKNLVGLSNTTATVAGAGGSGGKKGKSETEQMLSKLVGLVDSINRNIEIIAKKETQAATEGTSAPETVK